MMVMIFHHHPHRWWKKIHTRKQKEWGMLGPVEPEYLHESTLLQTVNQLITKYGNDPNYKVKSQNISVTWSEAVAGPQKK